MKSGNVEVSSSLLSRDGYIPGENRGAGYSEAWSYLFLKVTGGKAAKEIRTPPAVFLNREIEGVGSATG